MTQVARTKKLAYVTTTEDGRKVYTLGPIKDLSPFHRWVWAVLYRRFKWQCAYQWLWKHYAA